jgi:hypothetical protein
MRSKAFVAGLCGMVVIAAAPPAPGSLPIWMSGCWVTQEGDSRTEECWTTPLAGTMVGTAISAKADKLTNWENMRIAIPDPTAADVPMILAVQLKGAAPVIFSLAEDDKPGLTFYNRRTDYPQRVRYWREGDMLLGEIAMADGSNAMRWSYRRQR